jgi:hypothetical protein
LLAGDFDDFVRKVNLLLSADGRRVEMGAVGQARARTFGWDRSVDAFEDLLRGQVF